MTKIKKQFLITLAVVGAVITLPIIWVLISNHWQSLHANRDIASSRSVAEKEADKKVERNITYLKTSLGVSNTIGSSKIDICYLNHNDQGWMIASWYQDCYIRYIDGFETTLSIDEVKAKIFSDPNSKKLLSSENDFGPRGCRLYESIYYIPSNYVGNDYDCEVPNQLQGTWSVRGAITQDSELSTKTYRKFDYLSVKKSINQIWVITEDHYYSEELNCGVGILCPSPRKEPVHPEL